MFDTLCSYPVLTEAFRLVKKGKSRSEALRLFSLNLHENLMQLRSELLENRFSFGAYRLFQVYEPKRRVIAVAPLRDRIVHHAIILVCGSRLERALVDRCYACRVGKGQWKAVEMACKLARRSEWSLKLDISKYFHSIDHAILGDMLWRKLGDRRLLLLLEALIASYAVSPGKGLPIGNLTSQYFANLYLDPLDRLLDNAPEVSHVRYMDDLVVFGTHAALLKLTGSLPSFLREHLALDLKICGGLHRTARGVNFLGGRIYPGRAVATRTSRIRSRRKETLCLRLFQEGRIDEAKLQERLRAIYAWRDNFPYFCP